MSNTENPYAPPKASLIEIDVASEDTALASRLARLAAVLVDVVISLVAVIPIMFAPGVQNDIDWDNPPLSLDLIGFGISSLFFLSVHGYLLKSNGQTVGKKLLGIRIADLDGNVPKFGKLILLRFLPSAAVLYIPVVGVYAAIVDILFIFGVKRRCVHDLIAGTQVLIAKPRP